MIQLAAFLGNPGGAYTRNRHNAGRLLAETLPFFASLNWQEKFKGRYAALDRDRIAAFAAPGGTASLAAAPQDKVYFLLPETFMNLSGESVQPAAAWFKIPPERILVVHDELELPLGTASLKFSGGLGGHNGLRSIKASFGTAGFWRLRIGIGRPGDRIPGRGGPPGSGRGIVDWVLSDFSPPEEEVLASALDACAAALIRALAYGPETLLPEWGKKRAVQEP
ncbi:MAG: aminoacyl-tRNA hydrolase [Treponema sp.]|jgi:PTH1 family peptidyl-tRNA hydrolase|nr:aminoacyl-tRNA hydrolase [Treponema sp.]